MRTRRNFIFLESGRLQRRKSRDGMNFRHRLLRRVGGQYPLLLQLFVVLGRNGLVCLVVGQNQDARLFQSVGHAARVAAHFRLVVAVPSATMTS
jgi:hypothetical protein